MSAYDANARPTSIDQPPVGVRTIPGTEHGIVSGIELKEHNFPRACVPVAPVLSWSSLGTEGGRHTPSILDAGEVRYVTSGRVAIAMALRQMKIGPGDSVLVPSYHCASMIEPVIWSGATPVFYRVNPDTSVNLEDVARKIDGSTKLILAANYFGFPQPLAEIRAFCDTHGLLMLEDCAHCFLGEHKGKSIGSYGDYAIGSSMKFFPLYEGGCLVSARHSLATVRLRPAGLGFEAKVALNTLEESFQYDRMGLVKLLLWLPMYLKNLIWGRMKARRGPGAQSMSPGSSDGAFGFDPNWIDKRSSYFSRIIMKTVSRRRIGDMRRLNYQKLQTALAGLPGCRPLFPALPDQVFPWGFPLLTDNPQPVFKVLKNAGVPIIRFAEYLWPTVNADVCAVSVDLSQRVLMFPCHQELRQHELDWMINKIQDALRSQGSSNK